MRKSKIVLLVLYALFIVSFVGMLAGTGRQAPGASSAAAVGFMAGMMGFTVFAIAMAIAGGIAASYDDRRVALWVLGCLFVPWVCPIVLAFLKELPSPDRKTTGAPVAPSTVDLDRKRRELADLREKGVLSEAEYGQALAKLEASRTVLPAGGAV